MTRKSRIHILISLIVKLTKIHGLIPLIAMNFSFYDYYNYPVAVAQRLESKD